MKRTIYYFNPENDMALANFTPYYKAPAEIVRMANDLAALPAWYAPKGSTIKVERDTDIPCWTDLCRGEIPFPDVEWTVRWMPGVYVPWGWNPAFIHTLVQAGIKASSFPSAEAMAELRRLSGRMSGIEVLKSFAGKKRICGEACICRSLEEVKTQLELWGRCVLKAPWSGSGRGLVFVNRTTWTDSVAGWTSRVFRVQGGVMAEPIYNKVCDFAMEFHAEESGNVSFVGYSLFETDAFGNYKSNLLLSDAWIEQRISSYVPLEILHKIRRHLLEFLPQWLGGHYIGYLGVDMMVCRESDYCIQPCVEVNLRMNMGVLSRIFFDRYVHPASEGRFCVEHYSVSDEALLFHRKMREANPVMLKDGKLTNGYLSLTPVRENTRYQVYVLIG